MRITMPALEELKDRLGNFKPNDDPIKLINECKILINAHLGEGEELDPRVVAKAQLAIGALIQLRDFCLEHRYEAAAISILIEAWNHFAAIQTEANHHVYRAGIAAYVTSTYLRLGDQGAALRWALLTQADDILHEHGGGGGAGRYWLLATFGMSEIALSAFNDIAMTHLYTAKNNSDWTLREAFAEDAIVAFMREYSDYAPLFIRGSSITEFPLSPTYFRMLRRESSAGHENPTSKGDSYEYLTSYLFLLIPGWLPYPKATVNDFSFENDIVIRNLNPTDSLTSELFGRHFLIECKNWPTSTVKVSDVGYFLYRMRLSHTKFGVIVAPRGITRDGNDESYSASLIRRAFHEDGSICVVIDETDLDDIESGDTSFLSMLLGKAQSAQFGASKTRNLAKR
jgi:hypothetical protein